MLLGLKLICELDDEDRDGFAVLFAVRSRHVCCLDRAQRKPVAKDECNAGEEPRDDPTSLDLGMDTELTEAQFS
jgi:hypothetical protein